MEKAYYQEGYRERIIEEALKKIEEMPTEELADMVREALDESNIPYEVGHGKIEWRGLGERPTIEDFIASMCGKILGGNGHD